MSPVAGLVGILLVASQPKASQAPTIRVQWDRETDFTRYQTFAWQEGTAAVDPVIDRAIVQAIADELAVEGVFPDESEPDLHVVYHASVQDEFQIGSGYRSDWAEGSAVTVNSYRAGTLVVDVVDAAENRLVWRGIATATVRGEPKKNLSRVKDVVRRMFRDFPPER